MFAHPDIKDADIIFSAEKYESSWDEHWYHAFTAMHPLARSMIIKSGGGTVSVRNKGQAKTSNKNIPAYIQLVKQPIVIVLPQSLI